MVTATDLVGWSDFPKGLKVLLFDEDSDSSAEITSKLEQLDYNVSLFSNEADALQAISNRSDDFHVAIVEVSAENSHTRFKFLESAKDLPIIMISNMQCLNTMMKCIALGAVEFLLKPLSDEKLKNLWQHIVHKAFSSGEKELHKSLNPIKESVLSMFKSQPNVEGQKGNLSVKTEENDYQENSRLSDKCPTPPTPQLKQAERLLDDGDLMDHSILSTDRDNVDQDRNRKFVETTSSNIADVVDDKTSHNIIDNQDQGDDISQSENNSLPQQKNKNGHERPVLHKSSEKKSNRKKLKVDWTPELHKKFVKAVEKLGVDQAIPSRILELMKVQGLTRHNIASHLQKYRMQHRPILPKEADRRWQILTQNTYHHHRPVMAYPPYYNTTSPNAAVYPNWGSHGNYTSGVQMWAPTYYPPWQNNESWHWQPYQGMHADAWGCPVMPPQEHIQPSPQNIEGFPTVNAVHGSFDVMQDSFNISPAEEEIERVVKEAISKPWLPLPIGLKPPSTDSVLTELSNQGIYHTIHHLCDVAPPH